MQLRLAPYVRGMTIATDPQHPRSGDTGRFIEKSHSPFEGGLPAPQMDADGVLADAALEVERELLDSVPEWFGQLTMEDFDEMADEQSR